MGSPEHRSKSLSATRASQPATKLERRPANGYQSLSDLAERDTIGHKFHGKRQSPTRLGRRYLQCAFDLGPCPRAAGHRRPSQPPGRHRRREPQSRVVGQGVPRNNPYRKHLRSRQMRAIREHGATCRVDAEVRIGGTKSRGPLVYAHRVPSPLPDPLKERIIGVNRRMMPGKHYVRAPIEQPIYAARIPVPRDF